MEELPIEMPTKQVEERQQPTIIKSERISLGYLGRDGYYYPTKEEASSAIYSKVIMLEHRLDQVLPQINKKQLIEQILTTVPLDKIECHLEKIRKAYIIKQIMTTVLLNRIEDFLEKRRQCKAMLIKQIIRNPEAIHTMLEEQSPKEADANCCHPH